MYVCGYACVCVFVGMRVCVLHVLSILGLCWLDAHQAAGIGWLVLRKFQNFKVCAVEALERHMNLRPHVARQSSCDLVR